MKKEKFFVELTDTFGGEANYSWVRRYIVTASTMRGAVWKVSRYTNVSWHCAEDYGDQKRYDSESGATCFFIGQEEGYQHIPAVEL